MALEKIRATIVPELVTMDLTVVTMVLALEATVHPTNMALQTLETTGASPVTTALEPTTIPPILETMGVILALGLETMARELVATALGVMALEPETLATMAQEVITIPLLRLEVTDPKVEAMEVTPVFILATMVLGLETMDLEMLGLEVMAQDLETMAASLATMALGLEAIALDLATTVLEVTTMHLLRLVAMVAPTLATILLKLETTAAILVITGTATAHRLAVEPVTVPTWQTNWTPGQCPNESTI